MNSLDHFVSLGVFDRADLDSGVDMIVDRMVEVGQRAQERHPGVPRQGGYWTRAER